MLDTHGVVVRQSPSKIHEGLLDDVLHPVVFLQRVQRVGWSKRECEIQARSGVVGVC
jgi:hypothetical protein